MAEPRPIYAGLPPAEVQAPVLFLRPESCSCGLHVDVHQGGEPARRTSIGAARLALALARGRGQLVLDLRFWLGRS